MISFSARTSPGICRKKGIQISNSATRKLDHEFAMKQRVKPKKTHSLSFKEVVFIRIEKKNISGRGSSKD